jgi:ligand-binding sensor domain-containing protein
MNQKNILFFFIAFILFTGYSFGQNKSVSKLDYYKEMKGTVILDILPDSKGNIWIASLGGLVKFDGYEFQWFHNDPADNRTIGGLLTYSLFEDSKGRIWIGSLDYIYCYIPQTKLFKTYSMDVNFPVDGQPIVSSIVDDGKGRIYFGIRSNYSQSGSNALLYFDEEEDMMKGFEKEAGQEIQDVYYLISDNKGNVTFFTSNGVFLIDPNGELTNIPRDVFNPVFQDNEYPNGMIVSDDGSLWFTSNRSNLYHMNGQNMESWSLEELYGESVTPNFPSPITFDADENILIGGSQGLITFNRQSSSFTIKKFDNEIVFNSSMIRVISYDLFGNLWMGSQSEGLYKVPNRNILKSYTHDPNDSTSISGGWISRIFEDSNGIISIPSNNQNGNEGLNRLDPNTGILTRTLYKDMMPDLHNIYMINEIRPGELFFVSDGKYFVYNIKTHSIDDPGLISNHKEMVYVNNVIRDSKGILWICTFKGLFREKEGKSKQFRFSDFSRSDNNSNDVTLILESMENGIWVLTNNGLFFIHNDTDLVERHGFDNSNSW